MIYVVGLIAFLGGMFVATVVLALDGRDQWLPPQGTGDETGRYDQ